MTLKQARLLKHLADSPTIREASIKAGYTPKSNKPYQQGIKRYIADSLSCDPKAIKAYYEDIISRARASGDLSNERQALDSLSRINAMFTDRSTLKVEDTTQDALTLKRFNADI